MYTFNGKVGIDRSELLKNVAIINSSERNDKMIFELEKMMQKKKQNIC